MLKLDLPCCVFEENESEEFQTFLEMVDALPKLKSDQSFPTFSADYYHEFKMYLKRINILNEEVVSNNEFYGMCEKELHHKQNDHQTLKMTIYEMKVKKKQIWRKNW